MRETPAERAEYIIELLNRGHNCAFITQDIGVQRDSLLAWLGRHGFHDLREKLKTK